MLFSVANKAFSQQTWTNDKRHMWKQWKYGHSLLAVDGKENTNLPNCAIMDNYYVDKVTGSNIYHKNFTSGHAIPVLCTHVYEWAGAQLDK